MCMHLHTDTDSANPTVIIYFGQNIERYTATFTDSTHLIVYIMSLPTNSTTQERPAGSIDRSRPPKSDGSLHLIAGLSRC